MGHLPMNIKFNANFDWVVPLKWSQVRQNVAKLAFHYKIPHNTSRLPPQNHMPPPNLPKSPTKIKRVRVPWVALLIMKNGGCSLISPKTTNPNIIKVTTKSGCIIHPPN